MGKARLELARISPRDPKSRSSAHSDTSPSLLKLYYQQPILASEHSGVSADARFVYKYKAITELEKSESETEGMAPMSGAAPAT
jgi:hypothetical protein